MLAELCRSVGFIPSMKFVISALDFVESLAGELHINCVIISLSAEDIFPCRVWDDDKVVL